MQVIDKPPKTSVLGVGISDTSYREAALSFRQWIERNRLLSKAGEQAAAPYVCVTSVHGIVSAILDRGFRSMLNTAAMATPDGMPVVWALHSFGRKHQQRVYGPDLMLALCEQAACEGHRIFLYGGHPEALKELAIRLQQRFPALIIAGTLSPPFRLLTPEEDAQIVRQIRHSAADIVFVGLSTPKQERWMYTHRAQIPNTVLIGVGAAFDFHAGRIRQAPAWMQRRGLEWLFRLGMEPRRLWKRYLLVTPIFLPLWALQKMGVLAKVWRQIDLPGHYIQDEQH